MKFKRFLFLLLLVIGGLTLVGCAGKDGAEGPAGEKGPTGDVGPAGPQGPQGPQGPEGEAGEDGEDGKDGATGAQGPQGIQGETGPQGEAGVDGDVLEFRINDKGVLEQKYTKEDDSKWRPVLDLGIIAKWNQKYTVKLDVAGGQLPADAKAEYADLTYTDEIELPTPTREYYEFKGWEVNGKAVEKYVVEENATIVAKWEAIAYKVEFVPGEGQGLPESMSTLDEFAAEIVADFLAAGTATTTRDDFGNTSHPNVKNVLYQAEMLVKYKWFFEFIKADMLAFGEANPDVTTDNSWDGINPYQTTLELVNALIDGDTTAVDKEANARTALRQYIHKIINIDNPNATAGKSPYNYMIPDYKTEDIARFEAALQKATGSYYTCEDELPVLTLEGYYFEGWFDGEEAEAKQVTKVTGECKLYAKFTKLEEKLFDVTFDLAEGQWAEGFTAPTQLTPVAELPTPERAGYVFIQWNDAEGNKVEKISGPTALTAVWEQAKVDVAVGEAKGATLFVAPIAASLAEGATIKTTSEKELTVGTDLFATLDAAVAKAENGAVIYVAPGEYTVTSLSIDKNITLLGANVGVAGNAERATESVLVLKDATINADVTFDGFYLQGKAYDDTTGFNIGANVNDFVVTNCVAYKYKNFVVAAKALASGKEGNITLSNNHFIRLGQFFVWVKGTYGIKEIKFLDNTTELHTQFGGVAGVNGMFSIRGTIELLTVQGNYFVNPNESVVRLFRLDGGASNISYNTFANTAGKYIADSSVLKSLTFNNNLYLDAEGNAIATSPNADAKVYASAEELAKAYEAYLVLANAPSVEEVRGQYVDKDVTATVYGVVTAKIGTSYYVQDGDFAVMIYNHSGNTVEVGDKVAVTGTLTVYNGLYEIKNVTKCEEVEKEFTAPVLALTNENYNATALKGKDNVLVSMKGVTYVSGKVTVGTASSITFRTTEGTDVVVRTDKYMDDTAETALKAVVDGLGAGDICDLQNVVLGWYNGPQLTPFAADSVVLVEKYVAPEEPEVEGQTTVTRTVADLITEYGWTTTTTKQSFTLDEVVSVKVDGGSNSGKAYNNDHIRIYATDSPAGTVTISVAEGYELVSIKITTSTGEYAFLQVNETSTDISNIETAVSGTSVQLNSVKNGDNGKQVRILTFEVTYKEVK